MQKDLLSKETIENLSISQIKEELRKRNAPLRGRKAELVERLLAYIAHNINQEIIEDVAPNFPLPPEELFKDINADIALPQMTKQHIDLFAAKFCKVTNMAEKMYKEKFLSYIRYCKYNDIHFLKELSMPRCIRKSPTLFTLKYHQSEREKVLTVIVQQEMVGKPIAYM